MTDRLRWGILGTGNIANQFATGVAKAERSRLHAVGSRDIERSLAFAQKHNVPEALGSYEAVLADRDVQAVYVSLPNSMHHEWTLKAVAEGKHVLCEKPFAVTAAESQEMFDAAKKAGVVLIEAFMYRCHPLLAAVRQVIAEGRIGQVQMVRASFCFRIANPVGNVRFSTVLAGGALMDVGCYCLNFARLIAGSEPTGVQAQALLHDSGVDELTMVNLQFDGMAAQFVCGMNLQTDNTAYICGTEGYIALPIPWKPPVDGAQYIVKTMTPPKSDPKAFQPQVPEVHSVNAPMHLYGMEADAFAAVVQDGAEPFVPAADTRGNMLVLDEIRRQIGLPF
jgi:predicted dehydrogenase